MTATALKQPTDMRTDLRHPSLSDTTILLVDDHVDNADMLARRLRRKGARVLLALDGRSAIDVAVAHGPDLILMDLSMPGMSGLEATQILRNEHQWTGPIIALTAHAMLEAEVECREAGADAFATKPVDFAALIAVIETFLNDQEVMAQ